MMKLRIRRPRRALAVLACVVVASLAPAASPASAEGASSSKAARPTAGRFAPHPGGAVSPRVESGVITAGSCSYRQAIDDPHLSSGDASIHGWWIRVSGTCPSKANVDVYIQGWWCDFYGCRWVTVGSGSGDYYAGGGSGNRATARRTCTATQTVGWRGFVDVDLIGVSDPAGYTYSNIRDLACRP